MHWQVTTAPQRALPRARRSPKATNLGACGERSIHRSTPGLRGRPRGQRLIQGAFTTLAAPKLPPKKAKYKKGLICWLWDHVSACVRVGLDSMEGSCQTSPVMLGK